MTFADEDYWRSSQVASAAAARGHLHILQRLRVQDPKLWNHSYIVYPATKAGHLHILQWLQQQPSVEVRSTPLMLERENAFIAAAACGHLHIMRWLYENGFPWKQQYGTQYMQTAAGTGDLRALEWAQCQHPPFVMNETICGASVYLSVFKWLRTRDPSCPWDDVVRDLAQRAIFLQEHLPRCGLTGDVAVIVADMVSESEAP